MSNIKDPEDRRRARNRLRINHELDAGSVIPPAVHLRLQREFRILKNGDDVLLELMRELVGNDNLQSKRLSDGDVLAIFKGYFKSNRMDPRFLELKDDLAVLIRKDIKGKGLASALTEAELNASAAKLAEVYTKRYMAELKKELNPDAAKQRAARLRG